MCQTAKEFDFPYGWVLASMFIDKQQMDNPWAIFGRNDTSKFLIGVSAIRKQHHRIYVYITGMAWKPRRNWNMIKCHGEHIKSAHNCMRQLDGSVCEFGANWVQLVIESRQTKHIYIGSCFQFQVLLDWNHFSYSKSAQVNNSRTTFRVRYRYLWNSQCCQEGFTESKHGDSAEPK